MIRKAIILIELFILVSLLILCTACHKENTHLPLLVMPINNSDETFHLNKSEVEYYGATVDNENCSGAFLGKAIVLGGESKLKLPKETGLANSSAAKIAYANKIISATTTNSIHCIRTTIFGTQNDIHYVSNPVDFPVNCSGVCPDHCACTYVGKSEFEKAFLTELK